MTDQHVYLSTGCYHGDHAYCSAPTGAVGAKQPAQCKHCSAPCVCPCHGATGPVWTSPTTWRDPDCVECGGEGAPCCDPPDQPYDALAADEHDLHAVVAFLGVQGPHSPQAEIIAALDIHRQIKVDPAAFGPRAQCSGCRVDWPCPTAAALGATP